MHNINFEALGTKWSILIDSNSSTKLKNKIIKICTDFENNYSRFNPTSLLSKYNIDKNVKQTKEFSKLLNFGKKLEKASDGFFICSAGKHLVNLGYGKKIKDINNNYQGIDYGAYGKGWLIDKVADYLKENKYNFFLINAGGDIYATKKRNGESWNVALENPTKNNLLIGTIKINHQALAASSPFKRSWKSNNNSTNNHLINGKTGLSIKQSRSIFTLAKTAKTADGVATTLNIVPNNKIKLIAEKFLVEYLIFEDNKINKSKNFDCVIFD